MKGFSKTIDLGVVDCCAVRQGATEVKFIFWFRQNGQVMDAAASKDYSHSQVVDALFDYRQESLAEEAKKVCDIVMEQLELHGDHLEDGVSLTVNNPEHKVEGSQPNV
jgi:hypothetical protein